jgi:hypothetical protein
MKLVLKYFASELNAGKVKDSHAGHVFTNHMSCKLYNQKNEHVGSLITRNHYTVVSGLHHVMATSTVRLFGKGSMVYHLAYESPNELLQKTVRTVPHFKTDRLEKMSIVVLVGPRVLTEDMPNERVLTIHLRRPPTVQLDDIAEFDGQRHVLRADTVIQKGHTLAHGKLHVPANRTLVNHGTIVSSDALSVEGTVHNFGKHTLQNGVHVLSTGHYHVHHHLEVRPTSTPRSLPLDPIDGDDSNSAWSVVDGTVTISATGTLENSSLITVSSTGSIVVLGTLVNLNMNASIINNGVLRVANKFVNFGLVTTRVQALVEGELHNGGTFKTEFYLGSYSTTLVSGTMYNYISYEAHKLLGINAKETYTYLSPISNTTYYANGGDVYVTSGAAVGTDTSSDQSFRIQGRLNNYGTVKAYYGCKIYLDGGTFKNIGTLNQGIDGLVTLNGGVYDDNEGDGTVNTESHKYEIEFDKYYTNSAELVFILHVPKDSALYYAGRNEYVNTRAQLYTFDSDYDGQDSDDNRIGQTIELPQVKLIEQDSKDDAVADQTRYYIKFFTSNLDVDIDLDQAYRLSIYNIYMPGVEGKVSAFSDFSFIPNSSTAIENNW